jgi:hypothetical protein
MKNIFRFIGSCFHNKFIFLISLFTFSTAMYSCKNVLSDQIFDCYYSITVCSKS